MSPLRNSQLDNLRSLVCRRDLLKVGPLALSASVLPGLLTGNALGGFAPSPTAKAKSVIFLWIGGGVTHIDSLDPCVRKWAAPDGHVQSVGRVEVSHR